MSVRGTVLIMGYGLFAIVHCSGQDLKVDVTAIKILLSEWNAAHTLDKVETLSSLYSDNVNFYGSVVARKKCLSIKKSLLEKEEDFSQSLKNDLLLSGYSSDVIRCDFVKTVSSKGKTVDYKSYLVVKQFGRRYLIVGESDLVTDRNLKYEPDLGSRVAIKDVKGALTDEAAVEGEEEEENTAQPSGYSLTEVIIGLSFAAGIIGLLVAWALIRNTTAAKRSHHIAKAVITAEQFEKGLALLQRTRNLSASQGSEHFVNPSRPPSSKRSEGITPNFQKPIISKRPESGNKSPQSADYFENGLAFEKFVVQQFDLNRDYFTLLEWRSDKFHRGIYPKSNRNPDLEYEYRYKDFARTFSVECKYRHKALGGVVVLMNESKYRIYEAFNRDQMPVYFVIGLGGSPDYPAELFVIPLKDVKLEMSYQELSKYRSPGKFFYDMSRDRLT